jgi:hypothetical protein
MSEIKVDTLTGKTTANDITVTVGATATAKLQQGLVKAHILFDQRGSHLSGGEGTEGSQSLNIASSVDIEQGNYSVTFTNNMSNDEYTTICSGHFNALIANKNNPRFGGAYSITSSGYRASGVSSNSSAQDAVHKSATFGDLA